MFAEIVGWEKIARCAGCANKRGIYKLGLDVCGSYWVGENCGVRLFIFRKKQSIYNRLNLLSWFLRNLDVGSGAYFVQFV